MNSIRPMGWLAAACLLLGFGVHGGYSIPQLGIRAIPLGAESADKDALDLARSLGQRYAPIEIPLTDDQLLQLKEFAPFKTVTNPAALPAKVVGVRVMVLCAIEALRRQEPAAAECLSRLYQKGLICLASASGRPVAASIANDASPDCGTEPLNLYQFPCGEVALYHPDFFSLANSLAHEALHAVQSHFQATLPDDSNERARYFLNRQCNEVDASAAEVRRIDDLERVLDTISSQGRLPDSAGALAGRIGASLLNDAALSPAQRAAAIRALRERLLELRTDASQTLECRQAYKRALELFLAGGTNRVASYNAIIQETGWYRETSIRNLPEFGSFQMTYRAGGGRFVPGPKGPATEFQALPNFVQHNDQGRVVEFVLPARSISDGFQLPDQRHLLLAGTDAMGVGIVWALEDKNNDGYYEPETLRELFRDRELGGGLRWVWDEGGKALLGVNRRTAFVYSFPLPMTPGFPDRRVAMGSVDPRGDLLEFWSHQGVLYGAADVGLPLSAFDVYATAQRTTDGGAFVPSLPYTPRADAWHRPALGQLPVSGSRFINIRGVPGDTLEARVRNDDGTSSSLGSGKTDWCGNLNLKLKTSLKLGDYVHLVDSQAKLNSVEEPVKAPAVGLRLGISFLPGGLGNLELNYSYTPYTKLKVEYADDLGHWEPYRDFDLGGYGMETGSVPPPALVAGYFRAREVAVPALSAKPDFYTSGPGLTLRANVLANDTAPAGTRAVLDSDPAVHADLFTWSGDGNFSLTAPVTGPTQLRFTYHLERDDGTRSETVTVIVALSFTELTKLALESGADGKGSYRVPCLYLPTFTPLGGRSVFRAFPIYQFRLANRATDSCQEPHWHSEVAVFPLASLYEIILGVSPASLSDPDHDSCGFGRSKEIKTGIVTVPVGYWDAFLQAHPPPP